MNRIVVFRSTVLAVLTLFGICAYAQDGSNADASDDSKFIYADFQNLQNGRPVSKRGGMTRLNRWSENPGNPPEFRGMENANPPAPAPARVTADDIAAAFDYELRIPNEWAGVNMEVFGQPEKDGKVPADDVSAYKFITLRVFAKGPQHIRLELITRGHGANL
ncbi:MAG TPA: hypothetical protein VJV03_12755, partial [Pyrinomonadaceae bacterium]|nr:hypothetical protein [Pyrinomonadaceae bacterium]